MIKAFYGESLYEWMDDNEANVMDDQLLKDSDFIQFEQVFFYQAYKENEIIAKYPQLKDIIEQELLDFKDFIGYRYDNGEDKQIGTITIPEEDLYELSTKLYPTDEEFCNDFMKNPSETLKKLDHDITNALFNTILITIVEEAKNQGYTVNTTSKFFIEK